MVKNRAHKRLTRWAAAGTLVLAAVLTPLACRAWTTGQPITNEDRLKAMLAVRAHAYAAVGRLASSEVKISDLKVLPLPTAVDLLRADLRTRAGRSRARRAWAMLRAYGDVAKEDEGRVLREAANRLADTRHRAQPARRARTRDGAGEAEVEVVIVELQREYYEVAPDALVASCEASDPTFATGINQGKVSVTAQLTLPLSPEQVAKFIDPQAWDECSLFFSPRERTYIATDKGSVTQGCVFNPAENPGADPSPPAHGDVYQAPKFFEHYTCTACSAEFKNLLDVRTIRDQTPCYVDQECDDPTPNDGNPVLPKYMVCYGLPSDFERSLQACVGNKVNRLKLDEGALTACPVDGKPDQTRLKVAKLVQFRSPIDNVGAYVLYRLSEDEFVDSTADLACCE